MPKPEAKPESPDAWRFASLAQKDKAIREKAEALKAERAKIDAERQAIERERTERAKRQETYRANPLAVLEDNGLSFEDLQQFVVNNRNLTPQQAAQIAIDTAKQTQAQIEAARREQAEMLDRHAKAQQEAQTKAEAARAEAAKAAFLDEIRGVAQAEGEKFELVMQAGDAAVQDAYRIVDENFQKTGKVMPVSAALEQVETALLADLERVVAASKKLKAKVTPPPPPAPPPPAAAPRTLSNRLAPAPAPKTTESVETEAQRKARVLEQIERAWGRK